MLKAALPDGIDTSFRAANELYTEGARLIRARYPNADPSYQGLWTVPSGWLDAPQRWLPPKPHPPVTLVEVREPSRNGTAFPYFQAGVGGSM